MKTATRELRNRQAISPCAAGADVDKATEKSCESGHFATKAACTNAKVG